MSDGHAHCRSISVVEIFEMIKQLSNVIFDIVIALRICIHNFTHAHAIDTAKLGFLRCNFALAPGHTNSSKRGIDKTAPLFISSL